MNTERNDIEKPIEESLETRIQTLSGQLDEIKKKLEEVKDTKEESTKIRYREVIPECPQFYYPGHPTQPIFFPTEPYYPNQPVFFPTRPMFFPPQPYYPRPRNSPTFTYFR